MLFDRRVVRRNVEGLEVVEGELHLGAVEDAIALGGEELLHLPLNERDRVQRAALDRRRRKRRVEAASLALGLDASFLERHATLLEARQDLTLQLVRPLAHGPAFGGRQAGNRRQEAADDALLAEVLLVDLAQLFVARSGGDLGARLLEVPGEFFVHRSRSK